MLQIGRKSNKKDKDPIPSGKSRHIYVSDSEDEDEDPPPLLVRTNYDSSDDESDDDENGPQMKTTVRRSQRRVRTNNEGCSNSRARATHNSMRNQYEVFQELDTNSAKSTVTKCNFKSPQKVINAMENLETSYNREASKIHENHERVIDMTSTDDVDGDDVEDVESGRDNSDEDSAAQDSPDVNLIGEISDYCHCLMNVKMMNFDNIAWKTAIYKLDVVLHA